MNVSEFKPIKIKTERTECDDNEDLCFEESTVKNHVEMNHYCKKITLNHLKEYRLDLRKLYRKFKCSHDEIESFINDKAEKIQENVYQECDSPTFQVVNIWLEKFKENKFNLSNNELGLILRLIAATEEHPDPEFCEGINFRDLYNFLGTVMNGEPAIELNQPTKQFLWECFQEIGDEANHKNGDKNLRTLKEILKSNRFQADATASRLDPLNIDSIPGIHLE